MTGSFLMCFGSRIGSIAGETWLRHDKLGGKRLVVAFVGGLITEAYESCPHLVRVQDECGEGVSSSWLVTLELF
jgi:hypothetical protein